MGRFAFFTVMQSSKAAMAMFTYIFFTVIVIELYEHEDSKWKSDTGKEKSRVLILFLTFLDVLITVNLLWTQAAKAGQRLYNLHMVSPCSPNMLQPQHCRKSTYLH